jgi:phage recombination protein Bet
MSTALTATDQAQRELVEVLESSLYPGAKSQSIGLVLGYCKAAGLDPMLKPVHIVPMWDSKQGAMRDVVMPGIGLYRTQASRTGQFAGMGEPEFGPDINATIGGMAVTYPEWCRVTVRRALPSGIVAEFTAREYWIENYAAKGGKEKSIAPNAMWARRPRGQIAKCAEAQALRKAFPELGSMPTADEMEGRALQPEDAPATKHMGTIETARQTMSAPSEDLVDAAQDASLQGVAAYAAWFAAITKDERKQLDAAGHHKACKRAAEEVDAEAAQAPAVADEVAP